MPRTLSTGLASAVSATITQPVYLIQLTFSSTIRYSTNGTIAWNGYSWPAAGANVDSIQTERSGRQRARLSFANADNAIGSLLLSEGARGIACRIYETDVTAIATGDPEIIFDGYLDGATIGMRCEVDAVSDQWATQFLPRFICAPPTFNHLLPSGTKIIWKGEVYELRRR